MPEYLAPGVFIEETSFRSKSIEGVSTTTTGFIGASRFGPIDLEPELITSLGEFERIYGTGEPLVFSTKTAPKAAIHDLWQGVRAFFLEGGSRLYVSRTFRPLNSTGTYTAPTATAQSEVNKDARVGSFADPGNSAYTFYEDGHARLWLSGAAAVPLAGIYDETQYAKPADVPKEQTIKVQNTLLLRSRFPGSYGNFQVRFVLQGGANLIAGKKKAIFPDPKDGDKPKEYEFPNLTGVSVGDLILLDEDRATTQNFSKVYMVKSVGSDVVLTALDGTDSKTHDLDGSKGYVARKLTLNLEVLSPEGALVGAWSALSFNPADDSAITRVFKQRLDNPQSAIRYPLVIQHGLEAVKASGLFTGVFSTSAQHLSEVEKNQGLTLADKLLKGILQTHAMTGGNDGAPPTPTEFEGKEDLALNTRTGLKQFEALEDISIVAAPGITRGYASNTQNAQSIQNLLIAHCQKMRYRIAVLDSGDGMGISDVRTMRSVYDTSHAALYYPWVRILDPISKKEILLPPSGFVAGIYARNDIERAVFKAPANEIVSGALGFEFNIHKAQQEVLNPEGINCLRFFEGRGNRVWGARTLSSDSEWKYVNIRRYFAYLERSIERGMQWAVFEPNGSQLWDNVRRTIEDFLLNEWQSGALLGEKPERAYFVRCDRSTMTQNDLDNGRLVCLVGVAPVKPAEFVIFRIGQWTADRKG
ncbi:phage tail sheath family protein [Deinococcus cellulosilyticus]|uniref:Tail sheath protein n=1 Tax=Deinococcus cellulosilyticus (strain DSM 18568 / NBRC 106333 / KACC 11606 / 5516J-15) TaxID=1223518 RepID=A0A511MZM7_DEIC1|nr:phage tail sheath subtilisin-like domain-containing protein [Deinococcus cellulosilyticus]GEM46009.1 hypothetical protein DC3_16440 [Deinococcus cellulosilyticus NBRC 106333 = KACC 11606]